MPPMSNRLAWGVAAAGLVMACGGAGTRLTTLGVPSGNGAAEVTVANDSDTPVNNLYVTPSDRVRAQGGQPLAAGEELWGADQLRNGALPVGASFPIVVTRPGSYDVKIVGQSGYVQHIGGVKLTAGGKYRLTLGDADWRPAP
jgi:hypothetical protein